MVGSNVVDVRAKRRATASRPRLSAAHGSRYVFPSPNDPARPRSPNLMLWLRARERAGIEDVRLHDLRHTVASQVVARGVALSTVPKMLGHANPTMTLRYAHVGDRDVQAAAERIGKTIEAAMETGKTTETVLL